MVYSWLVGWLIDASLLYLFLVLSPSLGYKEAFLPQQGRSYHLEAHDRSRPDTCVFLAMACNLSMRARKESNVVAPAGFLASALFKPTHTPNT